jgi:hypothetical protein
MSRNIFPNLHMKTLAALKPCLDENLNVLFHTTNLNTPDASSLCNTRPSNISRFIGLSQHPDNMYPTRHANSIQALLQRPCTTDLDNVVSASAIGDFEHFGVPVWCSIVVDEVLGAQLLRDGQF